VPSTEALVERTELQEQLSAAVRALDEPYRTTVLLHYSEGLSLEEIARTQGVPASTVRTRWLARSSACATGSTARTAIERPWLAALAPLAGAPAIPVAYHDGSSRLGEPQHGSQDWLGCGRDRCWCGRGGGDVRIARERARSVEHLPLKSGSATSDSVAQRERVVRNGVRAGRGARQH
jgi:hypothetical protein